MNNLLAILEIGVPTDSVKSVLGWIVITLITTLGFVVAYFKNENSNLKKDLKEEREYTREQDKENIKALIYSNKVLEEISKKMDLNIDSTMSVKDITKSIKETQIQNIERLKDIQTHITRGK